MKRRKKEWRSSLPTGMPVRQIGRWARRQQQQLRYLSARINHQGLRLIYTNLHRGKKSNYRRSPSPNRGIFQRITKSFISRKKRRSEERRVGKECRTRIARYNVKKKNDNKW